MELPAYCDILSTDFTLPVGKFLPYSSNQKVHKMTKSIHGLKISSSLLIFFDWLSLFNNSRHKPDNIYFEYHRVIFLPLKNGFVNFDF